LFDSKIKSLIFNPVDWLDRDEQKDLLAQQKMHSSSLMSSATGEGGTAPRFSMPYASSPWDQQLTWPTTKAVNCVQAGRRLSVALRTSSDLFTEPLELLARQNRIQTDEKLFAKFDAAFNSGDIGTVMICSMEAQQHAQLIIDGALAEARSWDARFGYPIIKDIIAGRARQQIEVQSLFAAVQRSISASAERQNGEAAHKQYTLGGWAGFFEGMRSGQQNSAQDKLIMRRGKRAGAAGKGGSCDSDRSFSSLSDSDDSAREKKRRERRREKEKKKKKDQALNDGGGRADGRVKPGAGTDGGSGRGSGVKCKFQIHFPCSKTIIGPHLGVDCTAGGKCRYCKKPMHWSGECPVGWAKAGLSMPGYSDGGKRWRGEWDSDKNPTKSTTIEWVKFLKSKKNFPGGGAPALEHSAPSLADFEKWVSKAQP
jgi:hypothetical protein